jgi:hypothetical protein
MKNLSTILKRALLVVALMIVAVLVYAPASAGENGTTFSISGNDVSLSAGTGLVISLSQSLSLDLKLSSIDPRQAPAGEKQLCAPPIPIPKGPESDLHYYRLGAGLSFRF